MFCWRGKFFGIVAVALLLALFVLACGTERRTIPGATESPKASVTSTPEPTLTPEQRVTQTPIPPTQPPTPTPTQIKKKWADAKIAPATFEDVVGAIDVAYQNHPDANEVHPFGSTHPMTREGLNIGLNICQYGLPEDQGYPKLIESGRSIACMGIAQNMYEIYRLTGYEEFYQAAVNAANYFLTEFPHRRQQLDDALRFAFGESLPQE